MTETIKELYNNKKIIPILLLGVFVMSAVYVYLVAITIHNVVERKNNEKSIAVMSAGISQLEYRYLSLSNAVTLDTAHSKGFKEVSDITYVSKKTLGRLVSFNNEI